MTKYLLIAILFAVSSSAHADATNDTFKTVTSPLGTCLVTNTEITALFSSEVVTLNDNPYSKKVFIRFADATGAPVGHPMDHNSDNSWIPASDSQEMQIKEKNQVLEITYNSSKDDNGYLSINSQSGDALLKRHLAVQTDVSSTDVLQDFKMPLKNCAIDTGAMKKAVEL